MIVKFILLSLCLNAAKQGIAEASVSVKEVPAGQLAELPCLSSDDLHRFMFWQLTDDRQIIGPGNPLDEEKYNYEVLTGKLYIRVSTFFLSSIHEISFEAVYPNCNYTSRGYRQPKRVSTDAYREASRTLRPSRSTSWN